MANNDFIMSTLNVDSQDIESCNTYRSDNVFIIDICLKNNKPSCPYCGGDTKVHGYRYHNYNHLDINGYPSIIKWKRIRYKCKDCNSTFSQHNPFGLDNFRQSYALLQKISIDLKDTHKSFKDIAKTYHVSSTMVQLYCDSFIRVPRQTLPEWICIDEIHSDMAKYGGSYLCVLTDGQRGCPFEILPNRSKLTLSKYFELIPVSERNNVKYVSIDLWQPYKDVANKYFKNCILTADPYHIIKHLIDGFTRFRINIMNQCIYNSPTYYLLKKWNNLFLVIDTRKLDNEPKYNSVFRQKMNYKDLLKLLLSINTDLTKAYYLMDAYRQFNKTATEYDCEERLNRLIEDFKEANLPCYQEFLNLLINWKTEIINSFKRPYGNRKLTNAIAENVNERIRELLNVSNGYTNFERFRDRVIYCLNDKVFYSLTQSLSSKNKRQGKKRGTYNKQNKGIDNYPIEDDYDDDTIDNLT